MHQTITFFLKYDKNIYKTSTFLFILTLRAKIICTYQRI